MPGGFQIGRLFGTNIYVTGGFFLLLGLYFVLYGAENAGWVAIYCIALLVSLLVHEFGHAFAVRWFLKAESAIVLWGLGGLCIHPGAPAPKTRLGISLMGPAFEAVLGGLSILALFLLPEGTPVAVRTFVGAMVWINVVWVAANLLPVLPLDGGQALWAALELRLPRERAYGIVRRVSIVVAAGGAATALHFGQPFAAAICIYLVLQNIGRVGVR